jgi:hypothetical protein
MTNDLRSRADARLIAGLAALELADPREEYRDRLRGLRDANPAVFEGARRHYETEVLPALAGDGDAVECWIEYGGWLADLSAPGKLLEIDGAGRARPWSGPPKAGTLVLHVPDDRSAAAMATAMPLDPTAPQRAAYDLLVMGRLAL